MLPSGIVMFWSVYWRQACEIGVPVGLGAPAVVDTPLEDNGDTVLAVLVGLAKL